jgi:hypothetical protein
MREITLRGGEFLLKAVEPSTVFTPEDFTAEDLGAGARGGRVRARRGATPQRRN